MARHFDNVNQYLNGGDYYDALSELCVVAHFKVADLTLGSSTDTDILTLVLKGSVSASSFSFYAWNINYDRRSSSDKLKFVVINNAQLGYSEAQIPSFSAKISVDTWYVVVAAWDGTAQTLWVSTGDSASAGSPVADMARQVAADEGFKISGGGDSAGDKRVWDGDIAEVAIYTSGGFPSQGEVDAWLSGVSPLLVRPSGLASYWPLLGYASPERDLMSPGRPLTLAHSPAVAAHPPVWYPRRAQIIVPQLAAAAGGRLIGGKLTRSNLFGRLAG